MGFAKAICLSLFGLAAPLVGAAVPAAAQQVPMGSYLQSCRDVQVNAGWLQAVCQDKNGNWVEATASATGCGPGVDIANVNGRLECRGGFFGGGSRPSIGEQIPPGSYMATCRDIRISAGWLHATCQDSKGRWSSATTAASWCTGRDIANIDGRLTCR